MYFKRHDLPFEAICNDLFLTRYNPTTIPLCGSLFQRMTGVKCPFVELFHTSRRRLLVGRGSV